MKNDVCWHMEPRIFVKLYTCFDRTCHLYNQGKRGYAVNFPEDSINFNQTTFRHNMEESNFHTHVRQNFKSRMTLCSQADKYRRLEETCILHLSGLTKKIEGAGVPKGLYLHTTTHDTKSPGDSNN